MKTEFNLPAMLQAFNLSYISDGRLLQYRPSNCPVAPTLLLSTTAGSLRSVTDLVIPFLVARGCGFTMPASEQAARHLDLSLEPEPRGGVCIQVFIPDGVNVMLICNTLSDLTHLLRGPKIAGYTYLGGLLYVPAEVCRRFGLRGKKMWRKLTGRIPRAMVMEHLKADRKGTVDRALWWTGRRVRQVVIKEGRYKVWEDVYDRDMRDRIDWQYWLGVRLSGCVNVARPLATFIKNDNHYLVSERIDGQSMHDVVLNTYNGRSWRDFEPARRLNLLSFLLKACRQVARLHQQGVVHRDLTTANLVMNRRGRVYLLDLELAYATVDRYPDPPFGIGTKGFMSLDQLKGKVPEYTDDIYALGACLKVILSGLPPGCVADGPGQAGTLAMLSGDEPLSVLAATCTDRRPQFRLGMGDIVRTLEQQIASPLAPAPLKRRVAAIALEAVLQAWLTDENMGLCDTGRAQAGEMPLPDPLRSGSAWLRYHGADSVLILLANLKEYGGWLGASNNGLALSVHEAATRLQRRDSMGAADPLATKSAVGLTRAVEAGLIEDTAGVRDLVSGYFRALPLLTDPDRAVAAGLASLRSMELAGTDFMNDLLVGWVNVCQQQAERLAKLGDPFRLSGIIYFLGYLRACRPWLLDITGYERVTGWYAGKLKKMVKPGLVAPGHLRALLQSRVGPAVELGLKWIGDIPPHIILFNWSLESGMAGYGRLLLEAATVHGRNDWEQQAGWIAGVIASMSAPIRQTGNLAPEAGTAGTGRLFSDEGGAMLFLSQYLLRQTQKIWQEPCLL